MNGLPNDMAKNGLLVIRDFYEDSKFWRKWQIWEEYMKGLNKIQMRWQIRLPWQLLSFRERQIFNKNGEFDKGWSDLWQKLINELTNWESMWKTGYHLRLNLEWSLIWWCWNNREISDNGRDSVIEEKQSIFIVVDENISSDWNTSIIASRWN